MIETETFALFQTVKQLKDNCASWPLPSYKTDNHRLQKSAQIC